MPIVLYYFDRSPPCRATMLTIEALNLSVEFKYIDLTKGEQKTDWFKKLNPLGKVPVLDDNGLIIWDSHAINAYLSDRYAQSDCLYPRDLDSRAIVNAMMHFDEGLLSASINEYFYPQVFTGAPPDSKREAAVNENLAALNQMLSERQYVAGRCISIADFSIICSLTILEAVKFDFSRYPKVASWMTYLKANVPFYDEITKKGVDELNLMAKEKLNIK